MSFGLSLARWWRRTFQSDVTLICMRLADMYLGHPQMTAGRCSRCLCLVGIYPSGQQVIASYGADRVVIVCQVCQPPGHAGRPAPGALNEAAQSYPLD